MADDPEIPESADPPEQLDVTPEAEVEEFDAEEVEPEEERKSSDRFARLRLSRVGTD